MKQQVAELSRDFLTLALAGFEISLATHEFFGGLFFALAAGCMGTAAVTKVPRDASFGAKMAI